MSSVNPAHIISCTVNALSAFLRSPLYLALAAAGLVLAAIVHNTLVAQLLRPDYQVRAPPRPFSLKGLVLGNMGPMLAKPPAEEHDRLFAELGSTFRYTAILGEPRLCSKDPLALNHILRNAYDYPKPSQIRRALNGILGEGILSAEGSVHNRQRRIMLPSFSPSSIRDLIPLFFESAESLKAKMSDAVIAADDQVLDVSVWLGKATLDIIGLGGFDHDFKALNSDQPGELEMAFKRMFAGGMGGDLLAILSQFIPPLKLIPTKRAKDTKASLETMKRVALEIVKKKKEAVMATLDDNGSQIEKADFLSKDLVSQLVRANMAQDLPPNQRLSDEEVSGQVTTFMLAGQETSATALTWLLHDLSENQRIQQKLREELLAVTDAAPGMDALNALPYLDAVLRETLRLSAPVVSTVREAGKDDIIPLSQPIVGRDGQTISAIPIKKGTKIFIPVLAYNHDVAIWGEDALEYKPERFLEKLPESALDLEVPYGHLLTFLGGPRGCIGYRFSLMEMKTLLFVLVRSFQFDPLDPKVEYEHKSSLVQRPRIKGREKEGFQMLLKVRAL